MLLDENILESVQTKLLDELMTQVFVEGVLPFFITPGLELETDDFELMVNQACYVIGLVVESLKPALIHCASGVSEVLF